FFCRHFRKTTSKKLKNDDLTNWRKHILVYNLNIKKPIDFLIVGDDIFSDITMGNQFGIETVLVKTGKYEQQKELSSSIQPNYILESVRTLNELLEEL